MGIAIDSYRVNKSAIPPGLVARAMVDAVSLGRKQSLHFLLVRCSYPVADRAA